MPSSRFCMLLAFFPSPGRLWSGAAARSSSASEKPRAAALKPRKPENRPGKSAILFVHSSLQQHRQQKKPLPPAQRQSLPKSRPPTAGTARLPESGGTSDMSVNAPAAGMHRLPSSARCGQQAPHASRARKAPPVSSFESALFRHVAKDDVWGIPSTIGYAGSVLPCNIEKCRGMQKGILSRTTTCPPGRPHRRQIRKNARENAFPPGRSPAADLAFSTPACKLRPTQRVRLCNACHGQTIS